MTGSLSNWTSLRPKLSTSLSSSITWMRTADCCCNLTRILLITMLLLSPERERSSKWHLSRFKYRLLKLLKNHPKKENASASLSSRLWLTNIYKCSNGKCTVTTNSTTSRSWNKVFLLSTALSTRRGKTANLNDNEWLKSSTPSKTNSLEIFATK